MQFELIAGIEEPISLFVVNLCAKFNIQFNYYIYFKIKISRKVLISCKIITELQYEMVHVFLSKNESGKRKNA